MFASARDALLYVCEVVLRVLHLDRLLPIGHDVSAKSESSPDHESHDGNGDQEPKWTMTIETLSPRAFASKFNANRSEASSPIQGNSLADASAHENQVQPDGVASADKEDKETTGALAEDIPAPPVLHVDKEQQRTPVALSADPSPELHPHNGAADAPKEERTNQPAEGPEIKNVDRTRGERGLLAWPSAPADAAGSATESASNSVLASTEKRSNEDLERASVESNATDDTEEDRMRALYENPARMTKTRAARLQPDPADSLSSDDEEELKAELYANSPRCVPTLVRTSFTSF